ncbi:1548_t:CDS:2 [Diversispora eburnea]|uniref:1548_t:CDS:1 n=1 Tax=Diversispora eburnea TaxID=1213867 RepID=A0A9N9AVU0_9GLOM|nr:1548_t:CDS:2 [Diversispora eburnea]
MQKDQYHHYIPRFLRNFAINTYERMVVSNEKLFKKKEHKRNFKNKNKSEALLQTYDRTLGQLGTSLIGKTYGYTNMYKDFDHEDMMPVENKLATLEMQASKVIHDIVRASQKESQVVLTLPIVEKFMLECKLQSTREVWLQNIREILDTKHKDIKDNLQILKPDRNDYVNRMNEVLDIPFPNFQLQYAYHYFYVISPKLVLVLCSVFFREELSEVMPVWFKKYPSIFEGVPRSPVPKCVKLSNERGHSIDRSSVTPIEMLLNLQGFRTEESDKYTFPFVKVTSATVHKVNTVLLNETKPDLVLTFLSHSFLYKTIVKYHKNKDFNINHDFSSLKKNLFIALNRIHEENLDLRRNIPVGRVCNWNMRVLDSEPN